MKPFELSLALVVVLVAFTNASKQGDNCTADLQPCVKLWRERDICAKLGPVCQAVEASNGTSQINAYNGEKCENSNVFCPMTRMCMSKNSTCSLDSTAAKTSATPWGMNCTADHEFCPITMSCISKNLTCSMKTMYDWVTAKNNTIGPYGTVCSSGQKFCLASMGCIADVNASCSVAYNSSAMKSFCPKDSVYCGNKGACLQGANSTCTEFPSLNMTGRTPGNGWKEVCEVRSQVCSRFAVGLAKCWPKIASCIDAGASNESKASDKKTDCPQSEVFCNSTKRCQPANSTCCTIGEHLCNTTKTCIPKNVLCCPVDETYCNGSKRCHKKDEVCCPQGEYHCKSGSCIPLSKPCKYQEIQSASCPADAQECDKLVRKTAGFCNARFKVCNAIATGTVEDVRAKTDNVSSELCGSGKDYCPLSNGCQAKGSACNLDSTASFSNVTSMSPWGVSCVANKTFCGQTMTCRNTGNDCSAKALVNWVNAGNKSVTPFGEECPSGKKFCFATMTCSNATCAYNPVNKDHGASGNSTFLFNSLCKDDEHHCVHSLHCQKKNDSSCTALPALNYTGRTDNGTGWLSACKISNYRCNRLTYAVDMCYNKSKSCISRKVDKIECGGNGTAYCKLRDSCQKSSIHCCPHNETYCPDRNKCIKTNAKCALDTCTETACGMIIQKARQCEMLDAICPVVLSAPNTIISMINKQNNRTKIPSCPAKEKYCPLYNKCTDKPCKVDLTEVRWENQIPWDKKNCSSGKSFCYHSMTCVSKSKLTCTLQALLDWQKAGNTSVSPCGIVCSPGQKFCLDSYSCISSSANCTFQPPLAFNTTKNQTVLDFMCGPYHRFCGKQYRCVRKTEPCVTPAALNFTGVTYDNGTGFLEICKSKKVFCPRLAYGMMKCGAKKEYSPCMKRTFDRCAEGLKFCEKSMKCLKPSEYCLAPGECPPYQFDCPELGGCINKTIKCEVPLSNTIYRSAWFFQKLEEAKPAIFTSGSTIAIMSVSESKGKVEYHDGSKWVAASGIAEKTALVLEKSNMLRFVPEDPVWHGAVLFNYTVMSGTVGQKVDASSSKRSADEVIVSMVLPKEFAPNLTEVGSQFQIYEDQKGKGFELEDKMELNFRNYSTKANIAFDLMKNMNRETVSAYREYIKLIDSVEPAVAIIFLQNSTETGGFKGETPSRGKPIITTDLKKKLVLAPAEHFHGTLNASFSAGVLYNPTGELSFDMPQVTRAVMFAYLYEKNATENQQNVFQGILQTLRTTNKRPSKTNVMSAITTAESAASGLNKTDLGEIKKWVTLAYDRVKLVTGKDEELAKYQVINVNTKQGLRQFAFSDQVLRISCKVLKVNDGPVLTSYVAYLPPIAFNLTAKPNNGFAIKEITERIPYPYGKTPPKFSNIPKLITDVDGDVPGIGIAFAKNSSIGAYYYRNDSKSAWAVIDLKNTLVNGKLVNTTDVLLLKPTAELKFEMHNASDLWTNVAARKQANLLLVAWDQSDKLSNGIHKFTFPVAANSSLSKKFASAFTERFGCDGKTGSRGQIDACGKCGGDGTWCRGCDGIAHSGAIIDHCGNCTGGTTKLKFNFRVDCGGGCGTSFNDSCGVCQKYGKVRNFTDCAGECFGAAVINKCGVCVLGKSGKSKTEGEDVCGICGGDGKSCLDCAGTAKGTKVIDICDKCLEPTDSTFDAQCTKLGAMNLISGKNTGGDKVTVRGAGLKTRGYKTAKCEFFNSGGTTVALSNADITGNNFQIETKTVSSPGLYYLRCSFDSDAQKYQASTNFTFYNKTTITLSSVSPNEREADQGAFNVTITGSGFVDTGFIKCLTNKKISFPAIFVSTTEIKCIFPNLKKSVALKIAPQFGALDTVLPAGALEFNLFVYSPYPKAAKFANNLQAIIVTMNRKAQHKGRDCKGIFNSTILSTFGAKAQCILRTPLKMFITLRGKPTVGVNSDLVFLQGSLSVKFEEVTKKKNGSISLKIAAPSVAVVPKARMSGPSRVGTCGKVKLSASSSSGGGGRRLSFTYKVGWASTQNMGAVKSDAVADLANITAQLKALPSFSPRIKFSKSNIKLDLEYEFRVEVKNFLNEVSENVTLVVVRENKQLPVVDAGPAVRSVKASRDLTVQAKPVLSPCLDPNSVASSVLFSWELDAVGIELGVTDSPRLNIKKGSLQGGKTYTVTVTAAMASDQSLSSTKTIKLKVESSPIEAQIKGGTRKVVGALSSLKLDASPSKDPDGTSERAWYQWECTDIKNDPCFVPIDPKNRLKKKRLVLPTTASIKMNVGDYFESNNNYTFTMTFNKGKRKASASMVVAVLAGEPPEVVIIPRASSKQNPTDITIIKAVAKSTMPTTNVSWECVQEDGYAFIDLSDEANTLTATKDSIKKKPASKTASRGFPLVIAANKLSEGVQYKFRLTAAHKDSTAIAETILTTNSAPTTGSFEVSPSNGTAMTTLFTLSAPEGWSDDPDDMPLEYQFGYITADGKISELNLYGEATESENVKLPPGDAAKNNSLTLFVRCKDALGAISYIETTVTVVPAVVDAAFLAGAQDDILKSFESADWNSAIGNVGALMKSIPADSNDPAVTQMKEKFSDNTLNILQTGGVTDDLSAKMAMFGTMGSITAGGKKMSKAAKKKIKDTIVGIETGVSSSNRKRRAVSTPVVTAITASQAETTLSILSNVIDGTAYDSDTMENKAAFLPVVDTQGQKLCAGLALGMAAAIAKDSLVVLRSEKNSFTTVDTQMIEMACSDCADKLAHTAKVKLGTALQSSYASWDCQGGDELCSGACVISSQQVFDLLSNSANSNTTLTSVVDMKLYNPETYAAISVSGLASPVTYHLPLLNVTMNNDTYFECKRWTGSAWSSTGCTTNHNLITGNATKYVECTCTELGYTSAFKATRPPPVVTTVAPETKAPETAAPTASSIKVRRVRLALVGDYDTLLSTTAKKEQFTKDVTKQFAQTMNVNESRIVNVTLTKGSIVVNFALLPSSSDSEATLGASLSKLETAIKSDNFTITLSDGTVLKADPTSFVSTIGDEIPTTAMPEAPTDSSGLTETEIIIIACVCGGLALIILVVIVICCYKKSKTRNSKISPESSRAQLRGEDVEMKDRNKRDGNYNEAVEA